MGGKGGGGSRDVKEEEEDRRKMGLCGARAGMADWEAAECERRGGAWAAANGNAQDAFLDFRGLITTNHEPPPGCWHSGFVALRPRESFSPARVRPTDVVRRLISICGQLFLKQFAECRRFTGEIETCTIIASPNS